MSRSVVPDSVSTWTAARQSTLSMGFSRQEYWGGWPFYSSGNLPGSGIELGSLTWPADSLPSEPDSPLACSSRFLLPW